MSVTYTPFKLTLVSLLFLLFTSCQSNEPQALNEISIIPQPVSVEPGTDFFQLNNTTEIVLNPKTQRLLRVANYFNRLLENTAGWSLNVSSQAPANNFIVIELDQDIENPEGYELQITVDYIWIKAQKASGAFYAIQSLRQLLPPDFEKSEGLIQKASIPVPCANINDYPRFTYRGMHLDVCRHFFPVEFIKKYIDLMAMHKMNRFHWHLTEDQGWRIEIKQYPKLQEIAAYRNETIIGHAREKPQQFDGQAYGGYYTQQEVKEIIFYAQSRFITIIPEIELPGHSTAALAAYPELACTDGPFEVATGWGVFEDVYCPTDETFTFLENVLSEVIQLFPGEYIHIGGDECPKTRWENSAFCQDLIKKEGLKDEKELQSYFIKRIGKFVNDNGKKIIGWDEILEGGLAPGARVMSWRGTIGGIEAAEQGHEVVMTPTSHCYFDYYQSEPEGEPLAIGGFLPIDTVYSFDPVPAEMSAEAAKYVIGAQGNVWTEYIKTPEHAEYMAFPRAIALAEVVWTPAKEKNFSKFKQRLLQHFNRLDQLNVNYAKHLMEN